MYYGPWLQDSLLLAQCCLGRSSFTNVVPSIVDRMLPKVDWKTELNEVTALHSRYRPTYSIKR